MTPNSLELLQDSQNGVSDSLLLLTFRIKRDTVHQY